MSSQPPPLPLSHWEKDVFVRDSKRLGWGPGADVAGTRVWPLRVGWVETKTLDQATLEATALGFSVT